MLAGAGQVTVGRVFSVAAAGMAKAVRVKAAANEIAIRLKFSLVRGWDIKLPPYRS
jgi:hypothetical protein